MFKTLIILYALNFWVIECTPNPGRYSRTGWRPWYRVHTFNLAFVLQNIHVIAVCTMYVQVLGTY